MSPSEREGSALARAAPAARRPVHRWLQRLPCLPYATSDKPLRLCAGPSPMVHCCSWRQCM